MTRFGLPWSAAWSVIGVSFLAVGAHMITRSSHVVATTDSVLLFFLGLGIVAVGVWSLVNGIHLVFKGVGT